MDNITIPQFYCPISPAINPHVETVHRDTIQWARRLGLVSSDGRLQRGLQIVKSAWLAALTQPDASLEELRLSNDWLTWVFILDDELEALLDREYTLVKHRRLHEILEGADLNDADDLLGHALHDIYQRIKGMTTEFWLHQFSYDLQQYLQATIWEATIRSQGVTPNLTTYIKMRLFTSIVFPIFDAIWLTKDIGPRSEFLKHVCVQQLAVMANNHISWVNDILGLEKDMCEGSTFNVVPILQQTHDISLQESVNCAVKMCNDEMVAFLELENQLPSFGDNEDVALQRYLNVMKTWMRGHIDWYSETGRYHGEQSLVMDSAVGVGQL